ncbi:MAG: lipocalin-like domain-containing protein [Spirochaetota bacterium]
MFYRLLVFFLVPFLALSGFSFPKDHSFHPEYKLEWCYFVGILQTKEGKRLGYELSFFRTHISAGSDLYPVHFAISDLQAKQHKIAQFSDREIGGMAGYTANAFWSGDYRVNILENGFQIIAKPRQEQIALELQLSYPSEKDILLHGTNGYSQKSRKDPSIYSYYYSIPRLQTKGRLSINGKKYTVQSGITWMDHEWTSKGQKTVHLRSSKSAWDWLCLNLQDGTDLMVFNFRRSPKAEAETFATLRYPDGRVKTFKKEKQVFLMPSKEYWQSSKSGIRYPLQWQIRIPTEELDLAVGAFFPEQEFDGRETTFLVYWEGAIQAKGKWKNKTVQGTGYLELKGYQENRSRNFLDYFR